MSQDMPVKEHPFYFKSTVILFGLVLLAYALSCLRGILTPFAFALIIAILLNPLVNRFKKFKVPHTLSIMLSMLVALIVFCGILYFLSSQIAGFGDNFPVLKDKFDSMLAGLQQWLRDDFGISIQSQIKMLNDAVNSSKGMVGAALGTALGTLGLLLIIPVYTFLFLFYKDLILNFLYDVFADAHSKQVADVLSQTKMAIQSYMVGLLLEALVVATLNSVALLILGVDYAILLGVIGALLNMIPYLGGIIAIALPVLIATMTKEGFSTQIGVIIAYAIIQFIDNNILVPRIVSSKVQINALFSILIVLMGGALWGVAGMFLSIPFLAIVKIIFDHIPELKPWGKLLGDTMPVAHKRKSFLRSKKSSVSEKIVGKGK